MAFIDETSAHELHVGENSASANAKVKPSDVGAPRTQKKKTLRWLVILALATFVLLIFQILLGWLARAVTLLADSAHGGADVMSYGLNVFVEWLKIRAAQDQTSGAANAARAAKVLDTWGSLASLCTLIFATFFAVIEATDRLSTSSGGDTWKIGPALLVFSIVSTAANIGLLLTYQRWRGSNAMRNDGSLDTTHQVVEPETIPPPSLPPPLLIEPSHSGGTGSDLGQAELDDSQRDDSPGKSDAKLDMPPVPLVSFPRRSRKIALSSRHDSSLPIPDTGGSSDVDGAFGNVDAKIDIPPVSTVSAPRRAPKIALNLCSDFSGNDMEMGSAPGVGQAQGCQKSCCNREDFTVVLGDTLMEQCQGVTGSSKNGVLSTLHMAIHPGCTCSDHNVDEGKDLNQEGEAFAKARNLNLVAALLHLVTDVLRGILILIVALLIQLGGVHDAERADAVCALIVASLIAVGALALFIKVVARIWSFIRHLNYSLASTEMYEEKVAISQ